MALARTYSVALVGVRGHLIEVEADIASGLPATILVGLLCDGAGGYTVEHVRGVG